MSAKTPKPQKLPTIPLPPAITDPNVRRAQEEDRLLSRRGAQAAVFAARTNRLRRPNPTEADAARAAGREARNRVNNPSDADIARTVGESRSSGIAAAIAGLYR